MADTKSGQDYSASHGMNLREAHFPGNAPIDAYGNGGFRFAGMSHRGSIICLPSGIYGWNVATPDELIIKNFGKIFEEANNIEILLVGSGTELCLINANLRSALRKADISADPMSTGAAVRTYNILLGEGRAVAAAMLAVT
ncbi:unnamed protein product [marine sediment metagenome]|uniref:NADH dehydrogenase [ubiquinone] 1 alpha subcomplex assembly factor 3 n=1 Tax=marine sediment metagenome TaxID=412755 RepID=X0W8H7_9ZZZZ